METTTAVTSDAPSSTADDAVSVLDLSVIIVNYNVREFLEQALRSVALASAGLRVEVFVVDNNSVDGSAEMVRTCFPGVHLIVNEDNAGFSRANNQAIRRARGRHLLILNPDTIVQEDTLGTLIRFMEEHPEAGAVGCKILHPDGTFAVESRRAFPTPAVAFYRLVGLSRLFPHSRVFGRYNLTFLPKDAVAEVDALSGSCMLVRRAALYFAREEADALRCDGIMPEPCPDRPPTGAGLLDEDFFMYGEDLDWCFRIQQAGWKIYYTPETQIIHYKGESTKKGELRYVRLFYGAMLQFTQKHFEDRYSRLLAEALRLGIVTRAVLSMLTRGLRRLRLPLLDFLLVYGLVVLIGFVRAAQLQAGLLPLFYATVAPGYALSSVLGIVAAGGYRYRLRTHTRPVLAGTALGLLVVAAASFFIKDIAFSRVVVLLSFPGAALLLSTWRLAYRAWRGVSARQPRRALLVGSFAEARRLQTMLSGHPNAPFELAGYVETEAHPAAPPPEGPPRLGALHQLRDLVRLRRIDDVVFAADGLPNRTIFHLIQQLRDLSVQFKILAQGRQHVIGKASIDDLSSSALIEVDQALGRPRSPAARRAFELFIAGTGLLLHPLVALLARLAGRAAFFEGLAACTRQLPAVVRGRRALVGCRQEEASLLPNEWPLKPGVFAVTDTLPRQALTPQEVRRAYWFYINNQSAALDWDVIVRALLRRLNA